MAASSRTDSRIALLLDVVDGAFAGKSWHGASLRGSLRGLQPRTALWRPGPDRRNIWEYFLHAAYWKFIVRRWVSDERSVRFERKPRVWPAPGHTAADLRRDIALLQAEHDSFLAALRAFPPTRLNRKAGKAWTYAKLIHGVAAHDLHHTGQIQLVKKLAG